jgi:zinc protease
MESRGSVSGELLPEEQRLLPTDPNVSAGTLPNGVRYVLQPWPNTGRATRLVLVVAAGSRDEAPDERGFLHFVEHVAMDPAQRFGQLAPSELLTRLGATLEADANAETHLSNTQYFLTLQNADAELLDRGLAALAGWASQVQFTPEVVERQRPIVLAELRTSDGQKGGIAGRLNRFVMAALGRADWSPLGDTADLQAAAAARLEALYRRSYEPHRLTVVATGAFDRDALAKQIEGHFGALPPAPDGAPRERDAAQREPAFHPEETWILADAKDESLPGGFATLILQLPSSGVRSEQDYQADLADRALCAVLEARLRESAERGRFECTPARPGSGQVQLRVRAFAAPGALRTSVEAMLVELQRVVQHGVLESELSLVTPRVRESISQEAQRGGALRDVSQALVKYALGDQVVLSPTQKQELGTRLLATLRATHLTARARQWQRDGRRVLAAIRENDDGSIASEQALSDLAREIATRKLPPPTEPEPEVALMPVPPRPGKITHSERVAEPDLHLWTLDNGARVTFKRGRHGSGQALLRGLTSERNEPSAPNEEAPWNRRFAARIVQASGAGTHDAAALSRIVDTRTTKIHLGADVEASSSIQDFETTLQLLHLYLTAPRRDPQAFERLLAEMRAPPEPGKAFLNAMFPEVAPPVIADHLDLDAALRAYHEQFASVSGLELLIVADLEEDRVRALVEQYLASLPVSSSASSTSNAASDGPRRGTVQPAGVKRLDGVRRVRLSNRPGAESQVVMRFGGTATPSPEGRVELEALKAHLRLRLREVLREQLGAIYDADITSGWSHAAPWLELRFDCKPSDVEKLQRATLDVIAAMDRPGISEAGVAALRAQHEAQFPRAFFEERFWLEELTLARREGAPPRRILELPKLSSHLTRESMRAAARRHLPLGSYLDAVWSPGSAPVSP